MAARGCSSHRPINPMSLWWVRNQYLGTQGIDFLPVQETVILIIVKALLTKYYAHRRSIVSAQRTKVSFLLIQMSFGIIHQHPLFKTLTGNASFNSILATKLRPSVVLKICLRKAFHKHSYGGNKNTVQ